MAVDVSDPRLQRRLLRELAGMLREVTGESDGWADRITPASRLEDDLQLESIELAALAARVQQRYGDRADLSGFLRGLNLDQLIALTVADLVVFVARNGRTG